MRKGMRVADWTGRVKAAARLMSRAVRAFAGDERSIRLAERAVTGYYAAKKGRLTSGMHKAAGTVTARTLLESQGPTLRNIARHLARNFDVVKAALKSRQNQICGSTGPRPQIRVRRGETQTEAEKALEKQAEKRWKEWARSVTPDGQSLRAFVRMTTKELDEVGESFIVTTRTRAGLVLEAIEPEQLATFVLSGSAPGQSAGSFIRNGVEYDKRTGLKRAIYVRKDVEFEGAGEVERIEIGRVIHTFEKDRPSQDRGTSVMAEVQATLFDMAEVNRADLTAVKIASLAAWIMAQGEDGGTTEDLEGDLDGETKTDGYNNSITEIPLEVGQVYNTSGGDFEMHEVVSNRPSVNVAEFISRLTGNVAMAMGVPKEDLTGDYSKVNFSAGRLSKRKNEPEYKARRALIEEMVLEVIDAKWREAEVLGGRLPAVLVSEWSWTEWFWPGFTYHDPVKENQADILEQASGRKTFAEYCAERGKDWREQLAALAEERAFAAELGIALPGMPGGVQMTGNQQGSGAEAVDAMEMDGEDEEEKPDGEENGEEQDQESEEEMA